MDRTMTCVACLLAVLAPGAVVAAPHASSPGTTVLQVSLTSHPVRRVNTERLAPDSAGVKTQYGYDDGGGKCGSGSPFTPDEFNRINSCLSQIGTSEYTLKDGVTYEGSDIERDLTAMLNDGRLGRGDGMDPDTYACTFDDGDTTPNADRINLNPSTVDGSNDPDLCATLAHEWLHTIQPASMTDAAYYEPPAYQLDEVIHLFTGGSSTDANFVESIDMMLWYKSQQTGAQRLAEVSARPIPTIPDPGKLPDSNAPSSGASRLYGSFGNRYFVRQGAGEVILWKNGVALSTFAPLPSSLFFTARHVVRSTHDVLLVFGSDTTSGSGPVGVLTAFDADATHLFNRSDAELAGTKHPSSVDYDPATSRWYVLDTHLSGSGITTWLDTNGDDIPDSKLPAAFAPPGFPGLEAAMSVVVAQHPTLGSGLIVTGEDLRGDGWHDDDGAVAFLQDTNNDAVADQSTLLPLSDFMTFPPAIAETPTVGSTSLLVQGMVNHSLQVWKTTADGSGFIELLGAATGTAGLTTVPLSQALVEGWYVIAADASRAMRLPAAELVVPPWLSVSASSARSVGPVQPNPVRSYASLHFELARRAFVSSALYDVSGRRVEHILARTLDPGSHVLVWEPDRRSHRRTGVYFWRLSIDGQKFHRTVHLLQ